MSPGPPSVEMRIAATSGRETRIRLGGMAVLVASLIAMAALAALAAAVALVPASLARGRERQAMSTALERRAQLGERLREFVGMYEELGRQVRAHGEFVDRIRALYDLPELPPVQIERLQRGESKGIFGAAIMHAERLHHSIERSLARTDATLAVLAHWEQEHAEEVRSIPVASPLRGSDAVQTTGYGAQRNPVTGDPEFHAGIDFATLDGHPVRASSAGIVRWAGEAPSSAGEYWWRLGKIVVVAHGSRYRTIYGHCDRIVARVGQRVVSGQTLATVGRSGWTPTPRLHFEIRWRDGEGDWVAVDPARLLIDVALVPADLDRRSPESPDPPAPARLPRSLSR